MSNSQTANIKNLAATATAVVGGIALMTKLAKDEFQHRNMKLKTDPNNVYSSIRILPDLVRFQGFIRIHRHTGDIVSHVPRKVKQTKKESEHKTDTTDTTQVSETKDSNTDKMESDINDVSMENNENNNDPNIEIKWLSNAEEQKQNNEPNSGWFNSLSNFGSNVKKSINKLQTMMEEQTIEFESDFPFVLRQSAIHKSELESFIMANNAFLDLFEPISTEQSIEEIKKSNKGSLPMNEKWEFCPVKIHHETLFIRYAKKWITLPLKGISIKPLTLHNNDCTAFIVDYEQYFVISESKGYVLLCQHLKQPCLGDLNLSKADSAVSKIEIPSQYLCCPWPYVQRYLIGYHNTNYVSLRKERVLRRIVERVSNAMKDDGFNNHVCYLHTLQFRKCIDGIVSQINGADKALEFKKQKKNGNCNKRSNDADSEEDEDIAMDMIQQSIEENNSNEDVQMENEASKKSIAPESETETEIESESESLPYLNLINDRYHGLDVEHLSELDWKLTAEASWLSNYVYDIREPQQPSVPRKRRDSWTHFKSYMPFTASTHNVLDLSAENNNREMKEEKNIKYRGPPQLSEDGLWQKHSNTHFKNLSKFGFELLDYAITQKGQSVQYLIARSYDNPNTIFLVFKGTSNPLDAIANIGLHPLEMSYLQCSVFSGMYAALQQSLSQICRKLNIYGSEQYFKSNACPPKSESHTKIYRLVIAGHSLGGGYAQLFLAHLLSTNEFENYFEDIKCITFGAPLVFCHDIKHSFLYKKLDEMVLNFVYEFDLVPRLQNGMGSAYRSKLLQGLLMSQLPVSNIGIVFDLNQRLNYVLSIFERHQWLLDRYCSVGKYIVLFEKDEPKAIDHNNRCFTKSAKSNHICLNAQQVLTMTSMVPKSEPIYAVQVLDDHKMLNYMKTIMFQQF